MKTPHETHVCRDCEAEITVPYARPPAMDHADAQEIARLVRTVEEVQAALTQSVGGSSWTYDRQSWEVFVGKQMQRILDVLAPPEETP